MEQLFFLFFVFFLPPPQPSQSQWESLHSSKTSGWNPSASPLLGPMVPHHWMDWKSWGLWAPCGLLNWQVGEEKTTCLIVVWRPSPLKDLSSNLWRAFSPKWAVTCKELTNFHWSFPGRKRSPSFWNHPIWSSWKPSLLALRVSPLVYEGLSGKLVCGTKVAAPIRSWFCNAALLAA